MCRYFATLRYTLTATTLRVTIGATQGSWPGLTDLRAHSVQWRRPRRADGGTGVASATCNGVALGLTWPDSGQAG